MAKTDKPHQWDLLSDSRIHEHFPNEEPKLSTREALDFGPPPAWQTRLVSWRPSKGTQTIIIVIICTIIWFGILALGLWLTGGL